MLVWLASLVIASHDPCPGTGSPNQHDRGQPVGPWIVSHANGTRAAELCFVDGKLDGLATHWYPSGRLLSQGRYRRGVMIGRWRSWDSYGNVVEMEYGDGGRAGYVPKKNGRITYWGPRGKQCEGEWLDDVQHGRWTNWYVNGSDEQEFVHGKREGAWTMYDASGAVTQRSHWHDGKQHGTATRWTGQHKVEETEYVGGERHGAFTQWHANGVVNTIGRYRRGALDGVWLGHHANGVTRFRNQYAAGVLDGEWIEWDDRGRVTKLERWSHGTRVAPRARARTAVERRPDPSHLGRSVQGPE